MNLRIQTAVTNTDQKRTDKSDNLTCQWAILHRLSLDFFIKSTYLN
jgi:hypothetical protein